MKFIADYRNKNKYKLQMHDQFDHNSHQQIQVLSHKSNYSIVFSKQNTKRIHYSVSKFSAICITVYKA